MQDNEYISFSFTNFYYANQVLGIVNNIKQVVEVIGTPNPVPHFDYPTFGIDFNYSTLDNTIIDGKKYYSFKNFTGKITLTNATAANGGYLIFTEPYFLQIWKEIYVLTPLQTQNIMMKSSNISFDNMDGYLMYDIRTPDGQNYRTKRFNNDYKTFSKMFIVAYYVNSVSFNNYVSLQNNYDLQYMDIDQYFTLESLKSMRFYLIDENGI